MADSSDSMLQYGTTDVNMAFNNFIEGPNKFEFDIQKPKIHVRFQKTGPRSITIVEGLDDDLDQPRISRAMRKVFKCSSSIQKDKDGNDVIQLQGDHRTNVRDWLLAQEIITTKDLKERLVIHGF